MGTWTREGGVFVAPEEPQKPRVMRCLHPANLLSPRGVTNTESRVVIGTLGARASLATAMEIPSDTQRASTQAWSFL